MKISLTLGDPNVQNFVYIFTTIADIITIHLLATSVKHL